MQGAAIHSGILSIKIGPGDSAAGKQSCELFSERAGLDPASRLGTIKKDFQKKVFFYLGPEGFEPTTKGL